MLDRHIRLLGEYFATVEDHRRPNVRFPLNEVLMSGAALFAFKDPSLLAFRDQYRTRGENLERVYGIHALPGDTALRDSLDGVDPASLMGAFVHLTEGLRGGDALAGHRVLGGYLPLSFDATGQFHSGKIKCPACLTKKHRDGRVSYHHQLMGAVITAPRQSRVFPLGCEAILNGDGSTKNDCELVASRRLLKRLLEQYDGERFLLLFDALYNNGPHIRRILEAQQDYLIVNKGDNYVQVQVDALRRANELKGCSIREGAVVHHFEYAADLVLNGANREVSTNYFSCRSVRVSDGEQIFFGSWITSLPVGPHNLVELMWTARGRWKIENETFNTLKTKGYNIEHNYGHGKQHLATNFAILCFLVFLADQLAEHDSPVFAAAKRASGSYARLWEKVRQLFCIFQIRCMAKLYQYIADKEEVSKPMLI